MWRKFVVKRKHNNQFKMTPYCLAGAHSSLILAKRNLPINRALGSIMKKAFLTIIILSCFGYAHAARNLILVPNNVTYELASGHKISIKASEDRRKLISVTVSKGANIIRVPTVDLARAVNPVLSSIKISGGTMRSKNIEIPRNITIGFGAHYCDLHECPSSITFHFEDGQYSSYFVMGD